MAPIELHDAEEYFKPAFEDHKDKSCCKHSPYMADECPKCDSDYTKPHKGVYERPKGT